MLTVMKRLTDGLYRLPALLLTLTALFWGGNTIAGQLAVGEIGPLALVFLRWAVVGAILWALFGHEVRAHWAEIRPKLLSIVLMAALGFTGFNALFYFAAYQTTAVNIGIIQGAMPGFVLLGAFLAHGARVGPVQLLGVALTAVGVVLIATRGAPQRVFAIEYNGGDLLMLLACVLYAFYAVALRNRPAMPGRAFFTLLALIAAVTAVPFAVGEALQPGYAAPTAKGLLVTLYVAVFPSCLAQLFFLRGVDLIGPGRAGVFINLVPVFGATLAVLILGEPFEGFHAVAMALVLGGIWLAQRPEPAARPAA